MIKKLIYILILIIIIGSNPVFALVKQGTVEYNGCLYAFKSGDEINFLKNANKNMVLFEKTESEKDRDFYLNEAMRYYFLLSKVMPNSTEAQIGLGRIYDEKKIDKYAKKHFYTAINFDINNPHANFYFAEFYYKRNDLTMAIPYYLQAYKHGYCDNAYINYKLGLAYEKLADIEAAKKFYARALKLDPEKVELTDKILLLDELNYSESQYYLFDRDGQKDLQNRGKSN